MIIFGCREETKQHQDLRYMTLKIQCIAHSLIQGLNEMVILQIAFLAKHSAGVSETGMLVQKVLEQLCIKVLFHKLEMRS